MNLGPRGITDQVKDLMFEKRCEVYLLTEWTVRTDSQKRTAEDMFAPHDDPTRQCFLDTDRRSGIICDFSQWTHPPTVEPVTLTDEIAGWVTAVRVTTVDGDSTIFLAVYCSSVSTSIRKDQLSNLGAFLGGIPPTDHLIIGGDWNCVLSKEDTSNPSAFHETDADVKALAKLVAELEVMDLHLVHEPQTTQTTNNRGGGTRRRLDRIYASKRWADTTKVVQIHPHIVGNTHQPVFVTFGRRSYGTRTALREYQFPSLSWLDLRPRSGGGMPRVAKTCLQ